jgi:3-hydroxyacyl-CoA dehydrogenase
VATPGAQIALPEVKLGLLPGAGGTQRLPRLVGLEKAVNMIVSGAFIPAEKLADTALFDELVAPGADLLAAAIAFAGKIADVRPLPKVRERKVDYPNHEAFLQFTRNTVKAMSGLFPAPLECVETVAASVTHKFEDGLARARALPAPADAGIGAAPCALSSAAPARCRTLADTPTREIRQQP